MRPTITFDHNRSMLGSAHPLGLRNSPEAFAAWALYYSKFASAYNAQNLTLWGFTVQNEPEFSAPWGGGVLVLRGAFERRPRVDGVEGAQTRRAGASMAWRRKNTQHRWRIEHTHDYTSQKQHRKKNTGGRPAAGTLLPQQILSETISGHDSRRTIPLCYYSSSTTTGTTSWRGAILYMETKTRRSTWTAWPSTGTLVA